MPSTLRVAGQQLRQHRGSLRPATETWGVVEGIGGSSGLAQGPDDLMYISQGGNVHAVHIDTLDIMATWTTDGTVKGPCGTTPPARAGRTTPKR